MATNAPRTSIARLEFSALTLAWQIALERLKRFERPPAARVFPARHARSGATRGSEAHENIARN